MNKLGQFKRKENEKSEKGITLIALVITIIVLLILAGVSIATLGGQDGILSKATEAKTTTLKKSAEEAIGMVIDEWAMEKYTGTQKLKEFLEEKVTKNIIDGVVANADGTFEVEKDGYLGTISADGELTEIAKVKSLKIGTYVKYNVTYTDMYSEYEFTENDGWRVLDTGTKNGDGTYSGVKLVSTGIPANLYYFYSTMTSTTPWAGTAQQITNYTSKFYTSGSATNPNMYAAAGLYYNFGKIVFNQGTSASTENTGYFTKVNNKTTGALTAGEFLANGATEVHNLTMYELNEARNKKAESSDNTAFGLNQGDPNSTASITTSNDAAQGLFYLRGLGDKYNNYSSKSPYYWLASPHFVTTNNVLYVNYVGDFNSDNHTNGVRPVVSLPSNVTLEIIGD